MDEAMRELVRGWLVKAQHDLATARKAAADPDPYLDTAIYHCQQAAEKAIKGFLVFHGQRFEKTHNIPVLITLALPFAEGLGSWLDAAEQLTPNVFAASAGRTAGLKAARLAGLCGKNTYATEFRYPGLGLEPDRTEFESAFKSAEGFCAYMLSLLPDEVRP